MQKIKNKYDWIVLGAGSGGLSVVETAAERNQRVLLIESNDIGGTCVNVGCVPKKMMWNLVEIYNRSQQLEDYQFSPYLGTLNFAKFVKNRDIKIKEIVQYYQKYLKDKCDYIQGFGEFIEKGIIKVNDTYYQGKQIVFSTGSRSIIPTDVEGWELGKTSNDFFNLNKVPKKAVIVGSGYIALELAGMINSLQKICYKTNDTTVIVRSNQVLKQMDSYITKELISSMEKQGVAFLFNTTIKKIIKNTNKKTEILTNNNTKIETEFLLWAIGRTPNTTFLNENHPFNINKNATFSVDKNFETNIKDHYAIGDLAPTPQLTPVAIQTGRRLVRRVIDKDETEKLNQKTFPTVVFTHPPIGTVGLSEEKSRENNNKTTVYLSEFSAMINTFTKNPTKTKIKLVCEGKEKIVVGLHLIGDFSDEILQGFVVAINQNLTKKELDRTIAIHPTSAEEVVTLKPMI